MFWSAFLGVLAAWLTYYFARPLLKKLKWKAKYGRNIMYGATLLIVAILCFIYPGFWFVVFGLCLVAFLWGIRNPNTNQRLIGQILGLKYNGEYPKKIKFF